MTNPMEALSLTGVTVPLSLALSSVTLAPSQPLPQLASVEAAQHKPSSSSTIHTPGNTLTSPPSGSQIAPSFDDSYELAHSIPGLGQEKRYPNAKVESASWTQTQYNDRFKFVADEMHRAVNSDPDLRDRAWSIKYVHEMVGNSADKARPCIIVFCLREDFKSLRALFNARVKDPLYCGKRSLPYRLFHTQKSENAPVAPFELIYYRTNYPIKRTAAEKHMVAHFNSPLTYCGGVVQLGTRTRTATLGLAVQIGSFYAVTTVDHCLLEPELGHVVSTNTEIPAESDASSDSTLSEMEDLRGLWVDTGAEYSDGDDEEIFNEDQRRQEKHCEDAIPSSSSTLGGRQTVDALGFEWDMIIPSHQPMPSEAYLDWAVTRPISRPLAPLPNILFFHGTERPPMVVKKLAKAPRFHRVPVFIVSGMRGILSGTLLATSVMIGSGPGRNLCEAWTVILDFSMEIINGESGSLVVDQDTNEVYGHIVGSSPCGHGYVVPMDHIFAQIKTCFNTDSVRLYQPPSIRFLDEPSEKHEPEVFTKPLHSKSIHATDDFPAYSDLRLIAKMGSRDRPLDFPEPPISARQELSATTEQGENHQVARRLAQSPTMTFRSPTFSSPSFNYSPLDTQRREIRLLTLLPGFPNDPIHCHIETYTLSDCPTYNALSYVWGDAVTVKYLRNTIQLDGMHPFGVTANLNSALRHLRPPPTGGQSQCILLWVDAICINQADLDERSRQVSMMREIYASAERVVVWLGEDGEQSRGGLFDEIQRIHDLKSDPHGEKSQSLSGSRLGVTNEREQKYLMECCADFFYYLPTSRPWFSRVWALQELAMAKNDPLVAYGRRVILWSTLVSVWKEIARELFGNIDKHFSRLAGAAEDGNGTGILRTRLNLLDDLLNTVRAGGGETLKRLIDISRTSQSTDPRDRIYGLIGLLSPDEVSASDSIPIPIDYRKPTWEVYSDAVSHIFSRGAGPSFLSEVYSNFPDTSESSNSNSIRGLPSWVPDFSCQTPYTAKQSSPGTEYHPPAPQSASGVAANRKNGRRLPDKRTLEVEGLFIDTIQEIVPLGKTFYDLRTRQLHAIDAFATVAMGRRVSFPPYGEPSTAAIIDRLKTTEPLWRTLVCNKEWRSGHDIAPDTYEGMHAAILDEAEKGHPSGDSGRSNNLPKNDYETYLGEGIINKNVFFTTNNGFVGMCVADGRPGDVVVLWFGSPVPFVLRPVTGRSVQVDGAEKEVYQLVGAAYVGGIMAGEMVDELYCGGLIDSTTFFVQ